MKLTIHVGGTFDDTERRVLDAVERADRGEMVAPEFHVTFADWPTFFRIMTPNRVDVLRYVHEAQPRSVLAVAKGLGRDYRRTHDDVQALIAAGLLSKRSDGSLSTDCDVDHADIEVAG